MKNILISVGCVTALGFILYNVYETYSEQKRNESNSTDTGLLSIHQPDAPKLKNVAQPLLEPLQGVRSSPFNPIPPLTPSTHPWLHL